MKVWAVLKTMVVFTFVGAISVSTVFAGKGSKSTPCKKQLADFRPDDDDPFNVNSTSSQSSGTQSTGGATSSDIDSARDYGIDSSGFPDPNTAW